jgi:choline monooxygenase
VDREALEHSLVRRLLDHVENGTTDLADAVLEVAADTYTSPDRHDAELAALFLGEPLVLCLSGALPSPGSYRTVDLC